MKALSRLFIVIAVSLLTISTASANLRALPDEKLASACLKHSEYVHKASAIASSMLYDGTRYGLCVAKEANASSETWWKRDVKGRWALLGGSGGWLGQGAGDYVEQKFGIPSKAVDPLSATILTLDKPKPEPSNDQH